MYTRSAIFEGTIRPGLEEAFYAEVERTLLPIWRRLPHALSVRLHRPVRRDDGVRAVFLIQEIDYPSLEAIDAAMASSVRDEARAAHERIMPMYDGTHHHIVSARFGEPAAAG